MYGVELAGNSGDTAKQSIQKDEYTLFLASSNHTEVPGFYVFAQALQLPDPLWDWDEFQTWPAEKKAQTYGQYFDQIFLDVSVRHHSECPYQISSFDHRESAQQEALGRRLHEKDLRDVIQGPSKGLFVRIPVSECAFLLNQPETALETLTVVVANKATNGEDETEIQFRTSVLGTWLQTKYFGRWFSTL